VALGLEGNRQRVAFVGARSLVLDVAPAQEEMEARTLMPMCRPSGDAFAGFDPWFSCT
jgi:hypothetical protein